jgi:hypothetical protein
MSGKTIGRRATVERIEEFLRLNSANGDGRRKSQKAEAG